MRVVMFGFQTWGHRTLQALLASEHEVVLVVTHPKGEGAYEKIWSDSVEDLARENGVEVLIRERPEDQELLDALKAADPDVIVACNWRTWIPPQVFALPKRGTLNVHDSLLPKYAGFSPLIWALLNDEKEVGVTAHMMDDTLDAGDIVLQRSVPDGPRDTTRELDTAALAGAGEPPGTLGEYLEAHVLVALALCGAGAKRLRWRTRGGGARPLRWFSRLGARSLGSLTEPHPITGEPVVRHVYEVTRAELEALVKRAGATLEDEYEEWAGRLWELR